MRVYFATKNPHKFDEVLSITPNWIELLPLPDDVPDIPESGETFLENALIKAIGYAKILKSPVVSDDSGLEIFALGGFPGIHSSRFMEGRPYRDRMEKILKMLEDERDRSARFVCHAVFHDPFGITLAVRGEVRGRIADSIRGDEGFGYDPIFIPEGFEKTFAELGEDVKKKMSHRTIAFKKLFSMLKVVV